MLTQELKHHRETGGHSSAPTICWGTRLSLSTANIDDDWDDPYLIWHKNHQILEVEFEYPELNPYLPQVIASDSHP